MKKYEKEKNILILFMLSYTFIYYTLLFLVECVHLTFFLQPCSNVRHSYCVLIVIVALSTNVKCIIFDDRNQSFLGDWITLTWLFTEEPRPLHCRIRAWPIRAAVVMQERDTPQWTGERWRRHTHQRESTVPADRKCSKRHKTLPLAAV